ncbi:hypothetical protein L798_05631 [Zootermopsis nevadensis]|uniref:Uncharacterized protein n=1 Tax=Zootermopsis nevadensis TaxID=136037 RepID=A0A067RKV0_ZOONE|nr:hypothetical protein L798_05631 [Zootermopsis nevadensis]
MAMERLEPEHVFVMKKSDGGTGVSPTNSVFSCQYHSTAAPFILIHHLGDTKRSSSTKTLSQPNSSTQEAMYTLQIAYFRGHGTSLPKATSAITLLDVISTGTMIHRPNRSPSL